MSLRLDELSRAERPFHARGSKVIRCDACLLPAQNCICEFKPEAGTDVAVLFLMYKGEYYKPTNTGRLIADVVKDNHAFLWRRTEPDEALLKLLSDDKYFPIVVFPHEYAAAERCIDAPPLNTGKTLLFIFLDGTWREAKKMFSKSPYLHCLPVLGVSSEVASDYLLRESTHAFQHCTAEVGISVLALAEQKKGAQTLAHYFSVFRREYLKGKPHLQHKLAFAEAQVKENV
ncbi:DTW domain-containing protein [Alteromonas mediterranea]|uniref:tRNA-uridine aminocarboxypropyltransferase n=1 Tax=Alteromonas mediterranea TaxID=314275 RepID=A0AAC9JAC9_9ALTE|nr:DTW domain-containing protein [Alteromonas mediterranea]APD90039.1 DTW domain-containing protein [Alteromonas mediterranea]APE02105.1 DTW domain-containing protein [Alteromonas mediterranea]QDG36833.1 DTW domain-containing protein [Alteromonas mediterranea]QDG38612.1 DTW domain-containing protein [Alteromonas mediterranea]